jgi:hypothetical protein
VWYIKFPPPPAVSSVGKRKRMEDEEDEISSDVRVSELTKKPRPDSSTIPMHLNVRTEKGLENNGAMYVQDDSAAASSGGGSIAARLKEEWAKRASDNAAIVLTVVEFTRESIPAQSISADAYPKKQKKGAPRESWTRRSFTSWQSFCIRITRLGLWKWAVGPSSSSSCQVERLILRSHAEKIMASRCTMFHPREGGVEAQNRSIMRSGSGSQVERWMLR